jgi:hypothetical protein
MRFEDVSPSTIAQLPGQERRTFDVGEQEGDRAFREGAHAEE